MKIDLCNPLDMDPERKAHWIKWKGIQAGQIKTTGKTRCGYCRKPIDTATGYRCFYCHWWMCERCAQDHFGMSRLEFRAKQLAGE